MDDRSGRDSRLLGLVIVIALAVLVFLARFRFPETNPLPAPVTPGPLERLAARATFEDLAAAVHITLQRVEPAIMSIPLESHPPSSKVAPRVTAAVRLRDDWAIAHVPTGFRIARSDSDPLVVHEFDAAREVAVVSRPIAASEDRLPAGLGELAAFAYVCVVEPTTDGPTASPMFLGRMRSILDNRWGSTVMAPAGSNAVPAGGLVFQLDGRLLGLSLPQPGGGTAIVPAGLLEALVESVRGRAGGSR
jgi:hypothetical protein